ncbi:hypothetical protein AB0I68_09235 [Streptomyces sp. NPDC050448]|uniref:hypothetical protein n=1 Tax=Streptomyces sp. NPDC050448 TaxID=3155404 RepID=UPI00341685F0
MSLNSQNWGESPDNITQTPPPSSLLEEVEKSVSAELERAQGLIIPDWASVAINIEPSAIPRETADPRRIIEVIEREFNCTYDISKVAAINPQVPDITALAHEIKTDQIVHFNGGWIQYRGLDRVTMIDNFSFGQQTLAATVKGTTEEASYVCGRLASLLWEAAGVPRKWDEIAPLAEAHAYRTSTMVDLGIPLLSLLSPTFHEFMMKFCSPNGDAKSMGSFGSRTAKYNFTPLAVAYCREIDLQIALFDETSGVQEECTFNLLLHSRPDANRSRVKVMSELESSKHSDVVLALIKKLRAADAAAKT